MKNPFVLFNIALNILYPKYGENEKWKTKTFCTFYQISAIQSSLENDMELLCLTGVEDKLQVIERVLC